MERLHDDGRLRERVERIFADSVAAKTAFVAAQGDAVVRAARVLAEAFRQGRTLFLFGNGGSAADAQHIAAEFVNRFERDRRPLPAVALTTDTSALTSIANDDSFEALFERQLRALARAGDVAIGISTSGNSPNVVRGLAAARALGLVTIGFTGQGGGRMASLCDHLFRVPSTVTARIQETHITLGHTLCALVDEILFGGA
ncbi:MAG TPA: D-sedoheptulose 7-phosphate isomerase [Thermodesulfobacteriota bacterium]|nr:D-sedoheptulose 7-phosphate isomerase [Thermodesulfobacteriota bacterium]